MGTPLPPNKPGNPCPSCWGVDKEFGDTPTPRIIEATLFSIEPGEFWDPDDEQLLLTPHCLIQGPGDCSWTIEDGTFNWVLNYNVQFTGFVVKRLSDNKEVFIDPFGDPCRDAIPNGHEAPAGVVAFNGYATFSWNVEDL